jgi:hypothetical protein
VKGVVVRPCLEVVRKGSPAGFRGRGYGKGCEGGIGVPLCLASGSKGSLLAQLCVLT